MLYIPTKALHSEITLQITSSLLLKKFLIFFEKMRTVSFFFSLMTGGLKNVNSQIEDSFLIKGFLNGDERDFDTLVIRYKDMIFNLCLHITGDYDEAIDCSQEVFIKMYKNLHKFQFRSALSTWIYSIALNTCRGRMSSSYTKRKVSLDGFENIHSAGDDSDPQFLFEKSEGERSIRKAISMLPEEERILIIMRDLEERSYEEITEITGVKTGTVKSRISRGRHRLRGLLQEVM